MLGLCMVKHCASQYPRRRLCPMRALARASSLYLQPSTQRSLCEAQLEQMDVTQSFLMAQRSDCSDGEPDCGVMGYQDRPDSLTNRTQLEAFNGSEYADVMPTVSDDYEYDYNGSMYAPLEETIPVSLVYSLTFLVGIAGNSLVIVSIVRYRRMQNVTNIFLVSLASADLLLVTLCVPIKLAKWLTFSWAFGEVLCKLVHYLQNVSAICSILTLTAISLERYYAILHPMRAKYGCTLHRARRVILWLWVVAFAMAVPIIFGQVHEEVGGKIKAYWCVKAWPEPWQDITYELSMLFIIFIVPLTIMTCAYVSICREMMHIESQRAAMRIGYSCSSAKALNGGSPVSTDVNSASAICGRRSRTPDVLKHRMQPSRDDAKTRRQVIKMLVTVIVLFALCWGPLLIDNVLVAFLLVDKLHYGHLKPMRQAFALMAYSNSCLNPIVYAFMSKNFRSSFQNTLYSFIRRKRGGARAMGVSHVLSNQSSFRCKGTLSTSLPVLLMESSTLAVDIADQSEISPRSGCSPSRYSPRNGFRAGYSPRMLKPNDRGLSPTRPLVMETTA